MKVERIDIYDFKVVLAEDDFNAVKTISDFVNESLEDVLANVIRCGFNILCNGKE